MAVAEGGLRGAVRDYGQIANAPAALPWLVRKFSAGSRGLSFGSVMVWSSGSCLRRFAAGVNRHGAPRSCQCGSLEQPYKGRTQLARLVRI